MDAWLEWLTSNSLINYPFKEDQELRSVGGFKLPLNLLIDAVVMGGSASDTVYLSKLITDPTTLFLFFSSLEQAAIIAEFEIPIALASVRKMFASVSTDPTGFEMRLLMGAAVEVITDSLNEDFLPTTGALEPSTVAPRLPRVLSLADKDFPLTKITGDVKFGNGYNMEVSIDEASGAVIFTAGQGLGLGNLIECPDLTETPRRIRTINGKKGELNTQNFRIVTGDDCIEIRHYPDINMIVLHDHCRECCDCDRLTGIDARITDLETP
jgi:hypothetical protein